MKRLGTIIAAALFVLALLWAAPSQANRAVAGYTLVPVTAANVTSMSISRQSDGQGGTVIVVTSTFEVKDNGGVVRYSASVAQELTPAQRTSLGTFVTNTTVGLLNTQENL